MAAMKSKGVSQNEVMLDSKNQFEPKSDRFDTSNIMYSSSGPASRSAQTVISLFKAASQSHSNDVALAHEANYKGMNTFEKPVPKSVERNKWESWTWSEYERSIETIARASISVGLERQDGCAIWGFNAPQWHIASLATIFAGGCSMGIYPTDTPEQVAYKICHSGAVVVFADSAEKQKVIEDLYENRQLHLPVTGKCVAKAIVVWNTPAEAGTDLPVYSWEEFSDLSTETIYGEYCLRRDCQTPNRVVEFVYTSGTTGNPKAVMLTHDNLTWSALAILEQVGAFMNGGQERIVSYLPLSHIAATMADIILPIMITSNLVPGYEHYNNSYCTTYFARMYDLKAGSLVDRLNAVRPTVFFGVPRVWEKFEEGLKAKAKSGVIGAIASFAKSCLKYNLENAQVGGSKSKAWGSGFSKFFIGIVLKKLGLDQMRIAATGGAPIQMKTVEYFASLGINICNMYGMSETGGANVVSHQGKFRWGCLGSAVPGFEVSIFSNGEEDADVLAPRCPDLSSAVIDEQYQGEIRMRGRCVMMGYLCNPYLGGDHVHEIEGKNKSAFTPDGWLCTGDKASWDSNGLLKITGRYKDLIIGAGGENVAPIPIENHIKLLYPGIANIMMVGDKRKYNIAVITLRAKGATGDLPGTDEIDPAVYKGIECANPHTSIRELISEKNNEVIEAIIAAIKETNSFGEVCPSNSCKIQKFTILPLDFSVTTGELTPSLKLKRSNTQARLTEKIEYVYDFAGKDLYIPTVDL